MGITKSAGDHKHRHKKLKNALKNKQNVTLESGSRKKTIQGKFQERVKEWVNDAFYLRNVLENRILNACDELRGRKKSKRHHGDMWW